MFTIYEENHDPKVNSYKVGWLCKALHAQHLLDVGEEIRKDRSRGCEWQCDELCNYIGSCVNSQEKMTIMGLGSLCVGAIHSKKVSFADHTPPQRQNHEKDLKFYMKKIFEIKSHRPMEQVYQKAATNHS
jgi:hypothetical protein